AVPARVRMQPQDLFEVLHGCGGRHQRCKRWRVQMIEASRAGRCLCGKVTVELTGEPFAVSLCHCVNCQKTSGSAFSVIALVPIGNVRFSGPVSVFNELTDSGVCV